MSRIVTAPRPGVWIAALLALLASCSKGGGTSEPTLQETLAREKAAAWFADDNMQRARTALAPLVAKKSAGLDDLIHAAAIEFADDEIDAAQGFLERALKLAPESPAALFLMGQLHRYDGDFEGALEYLRKAHAAAPDDLPTRVVLAGVLYDLDHVEEAEQHYREVIDIGIENGLSWYVAATYRMGRLLIEQGREEEGQRFLALMKELENAGISPPATTVMMRGNFGVVHPPAPFGTEVAAPGALPTYEAQPVILPELARGAVAFLLSDVNSDRRMDLVTGGANGIRVALKDREGPGYTVQVVTEDSVDLIRGVDLANDDDLDFVAFHGAELRLYVHGEDGWKRSDVTFELPGPPSDVLPVDFDHEGDMDLLCVGEFGARLLRNDGAADPELNGTFTDASELATMPTDRAFRWARSEDFDGDNDVDLLMGGPAGPYLADSLRAGKFADATDRIPAGLPFELEPVLADFDGDARCDMWLPGPAVKVLMQQADGTFAARDAGLATPAGVRGADISALDIDLDGSLDLLWPDGRRLARGLRAVGLDVQAAVDLGVETELGQPETGTSATPLTTWPLRFADLDGDLVPDAARLTSAGIERYLARDCPGRGVLFRPRGLRDNRRVVGGIVEVRVGPVYRRVYWRGEPELIGIGQAELVDLVRITYPNGIVQTDLNVEPGDLTYIDDEDGAFGDYLQPSGLVGSCPFLYTWNGEEFEFITDVLGITPLGLPMAPGMMVPPDHDEYVLVRGDQLAPKDGKLVMQITEELREVTYLDQVRLEVVDHEADVEVQPNERFSFPPFPEPHLHTLRGAVSPVKVVGSDGRDWTEHTATEDTRHAVPFQRLRPQFAGLAEPWFLELHFDPDDVRGAEQLRLVLTGWFNWSDASANMAAARHPGIDFVPPVVQVPDGEGGWRDAGPPIGFPAGKTKTMVVDATDWIDPEDPRLRVLTTLQLYWDRVALATCNDDAPRRVTVLGPERANLWLRGFSARIDTGREDHPEVFDWEQLADEPRWNQHPGRYTKLGDVLPLLGGIDDRYVILGAGDALTLEFDASELPPLQEGWTRDYLLFLDGWAKDRDPNTLEALEVEPLPFHGMSGYPYGPDESFPDTEEHRRWRSEWNTRPAVEWIVPASPDRRREWLRADAP